ncbi:MAG: hypothetical protein ACRD1K_12465 [Acidimicrobiales bacterium]
MRQRLEFGPGDDEPQFLDDITVAVGASEEPLRGGHQVVKQIEVGPLVVAGVESAVAAGEYVEIDAAGGPIVCSEADICRSIKVLKAAYDAAKKPGRVAPRTMAPVP